MGAVESRGTVPRDAETGETKETQTQTVATPRVGACGVSVAESAPDPPGPIPNPVVTRGSAGEYCGGDPVGGEAVAGTPRARTHPGARQSADESDEHDVRPRDSGTAGQTRPGEPGRSSHVTARGGAVAARWAHNPKVGGSNPSPATNQGHHTTPHPDHRLAPRRRVRRGVACVRRGVCGVRPGTRLEQPQLPHRPCLPRLLQPRRRAQAREESPLLLWGNRDSSPTQDHLRSVHLIDLPIHNGISLGCLVDPRLPFLRKRCVVPLMHG